MHSPRAAQPRHHPATCPSALHRRGLAVAATVFALLCVAPVSAAVAGQGDCNAPAPEAITHVALPGHPFEPVVTHDGCWIFVSLIGRGQGSASGVAVLRRGGGNVQLARTVALPRPLTGMVLTHDGGLLIATAGDSVLFLDPRRLISGHGSPVLGAISDGAHAGSVYTNVSPDDRFLFVSDERIHGITVIDLAKARRTGFPQSAIVGSIPAGLAPIALTFSHDGRYLYTTSEVAMPAWGWPETCTPEVPRPNQPNLRRPQGAIIVVDARKARTDPAHSVLSRVPAGCSPVRLVLSPGGDIAYVTVRHDNELAAYDTHKLLGDPAHALVARVPVGTAPVGVAVVEGGRRLVVTNSNRFAGGPNDHQPLTIIDAGKLEAGAGAVLGTIPAGAFPRELRLTADGRTLLITNFGSSDLQLVDLARMPFSPR